MQRKMVFASVGLFAITVILGVRLYQTTQQLDKAEQYMMSAVVSWVGACSAGSLDLRSTEPSEVRRAARFVRNQCVSEEDWPTLEALLTKGDSYEALDFVSTRMFGGHLPRILKRRSYTRSSFPVGYP